MFGKFKSRCNDNVIRDFHSGSAGLYIVVIKAAHDILKCCLLMNTRELLQMSFALHWRRFFELLYIDK